MALAPSRALFGVPSSSIMRLVDGDLILGVHAADGVEDLGVDRIDRLQHALAEIADLSPSRSSTASCAPVEAPEGTAARPMRAVLEHHVHLDGRIAAAVEDLAGDDVDDRCHGSSCWLNAAGESGRRVRPYGMDWLIDRNDRGSKDGTTHSRSSIQGQTR